MLLVAVVTGTGPHDDPDRARLHELAPVVGALRTELASAPWGRNARRAHGDGYPTEVQYLAIGDGAAIITAPGELATQIGFEMAALSPAAETLVVGYANEGCGYPARGRRRCYVNQRTSRSRLWFCPPTSH